MSGSGIMQAVEESAGSAMGPGTIYGTLARLEASGYVKELPAARADRRRTFALQPAGRAALQDEARRLARLASLVRVKRERVLHNILAQFQVPGSEIRPQTTDSKDTERCPSG